MGVGGRMAVIAVLAIAAVVTFASSARAVVPVDSASGLERCTLRGTAGDDVLIGTSRRDVICGLGGDDELWGLGGDDVLWGGPGQDLLRGGAGRDRLVGGSGVDRSDGGRGRDIVVRDREDFIIEVLARPDFVGLQPGSRVIFRGPQSVPSTCLTNAGSTTATLVPNATAALVPMGIWYSRCAVAGDWVVEVVLPGGVVTARTTMNMSLSPVRRAHVTCSTPDFLCVAGPMRVTSSGLVFDVRIAATGAELSGRG